MPLLARKLKNMLPKEYTYNLGNININGDKRGCSGFIQYRGATVYVNTEGLNGLYLVRTAADDKDYRGGRNFYPDSKTIAQMVANLLKVPHGAV
jgi:hypothetical protein